MRRKFSFDIPKLKIASTKAESRATKDEPSSPLDSPSTLPKSIRPPLPVDIETELRAACSYIFYNHRPSHLKFESQAEEAKPHNAYNAIKAGLEAFKEPEDDSSAAKYSYKPDVAVEDLFKDNRANDVPAQKSVKARASQLPDPKRASNATSRSRADSHPRLQNHSQPPSLHTSKQDGTLRPKILARTDSVGTIGSTPHTDSTDEVWSSSTRITSAYGTPAITSKRTSSQTNNGASDSGSIPHVDATDAEWMRAELEKHKKAMEERERAQEAESINHTIPAPPPTAHADLSPSARSILRKSVPASSRLTPGNDAQDISRPATRQERRASSRAGPQQDSREVSRPVTGSGIVGILRAPRTESPRPGTGHTADGRGRDSSRPGSRSERASRAASRAREQAASKVKEVTNGIMGSFRPESTQEVQGATKRSERTRSSSRTRAFLNSAREYIRPGSAMSRRKGSEDASQGDRWSESIESFHFGHSETARPASSASSQFPPTRQKSVVDLNRELPPLPSLDQWHAEEAKQASEAMAKRGTWLTAHIPTNEEIRASRAGQMPTNRPQRPSVDVRSVQSYAARSGPSSALSPNTLDSSVPSDGDPMSAIHDGLPITVGTATKFYLPRDRSSQAVVRPDLIRASSSQGPQAHARPRHISQMKKLSMDDYTRVPDPQYQNVAEISATPGPARAVKDEKPKRKWWLGMSSKDKRTSSWMDRVVQSGATNGVLLTDEVAGAPIVRY